MTKKLNDSLNVQLANWSVLYFKLHHFHWYVKGPHFPVLHVKFEELYELAALKLDELAERILAIEGQPLSTMKEFLSAATIVEADKAKSENDMLSATIEDLASLAGGLKSAADLADEEGDAATADVLTGQIEELQKQLWMLKSTLA
ncbi:DNA starvation/stationary phase protection protein [Cohnella endophytica]|uniref:DNA starvation/stationary phase protection protein n=1 Tax=Cohnella endophytica TaxID=2419778 RepID=A0A494XCF1_9BACL|nr:DNA starvation/stationary phase protection protein [Cohnella endophytica]RKP47301.1 DNA starvation/stationary phase protection protein [Cohnella endophytica]